VLVELAAAADSNLATHFTWVHRHTPEMRVHDAVGLTLADSGLSCDTFNCACRARLDPRTARQELKNAIAWFAGRPFSWWVGPADRPSDLGDLLRSEGFERTEMAVAMMVDLSAVEPDQSSPNGLTVRRVQTPSELAAFAEIAAANWSPPDPLVCRFYELAAPTLLSSSSPLRLYLGWVDGSPVATSELTLAGGVGGVYNVATSAPHRRRGFGSAMTLRPLLDARREGCRYAVLQAAAAGLGVYRRLGFEPFGDVSEYALVG